ncbi:MAG: glycosyltransferase family 4 protein [Thermodesulfovibrionales bacterium]|nr:glycosyltransferase family 4 protein [Thermodesulfovibrionales bacterium]
MIRAGQNMRIAIIKSNYTPFGGAEKYTTRLIRAFAARGVAVDVLTSELGKWDGIENNIGWVRLSQVKRNNLLRLLTFNSAAKRYLRKEPYHCILGMDRTDYQTHLRAGSGCHAAWIERRCAESSPLRCLSVKANPFHKAMLGIERRAFLSDSLRKIFCNSFLVRNEIFRYYPSTDSKLQVVHNGVEWNEFTDKFEKGLSQNKKLRESLGLGKDRFYYLFLGSGYERKGLMKAIRALGMLPDHTGLLVVGKDRNENRYKTCCQKEGLSHRVHFFGPQREVTSFLQVADAFVLPTIYDPFSNASLEALAMGLYTITSNANGCAEIISDGAGYVIKDLRDTGSVAEAMKNALGAHLSKWEIRETVKHLDFDGQLKEIVDVCLTDASMKNINA